MYSCLFFLFLSTICVNVCVLVIEIEFGLVRDVCSSKGVPYVSVFIICQYYVIDLLMFLVIKYGNLYSTIP